MSVRSVSVLDEQVAQIVTITSVRMESAVLCNVAGGLRNTFDLNATDASIQTANLVPELNNKLIK